MIEVSVVVPVRDDAPRLERLLEALARQTLDRASFEVLVADDGSAEPVRAPRARVLPGPPLNAYAARNRAARAARGRVLAFTDADCTPEPAWLERGLAALRDADVVAGAVRFSVSARRLPSELVDAESYIDQRRWVARDRACTANLFLRRDLHDALGGFDESLPSGGDFDLVRRATGTGGRLVHAADAVVEHDARAGWRALLRKRWRVTYCGTRRIVRDRLAVAGPGLSMLVPLLCTAVHRRDEQRPLTRLDPRRLAESGLTTGRREGACCMALIYLVLDPLTVAARVAGGLRGLADRRHRRRSVAPSRVIVHPGLWATSHGWPSGSTKTPE